MNVDQHEVNKFSELAPDWWNLTGAFKTLHAINPLRLQFIQARLELAGQKVIDIGCGGGILAEGLAKAGAAVTGIDMSAAAIEVAKQHWQNATLALNNPSIIDYRVVTAESLLEAEANTYDALTCMELLEHVPDPASTIQACAGLVKPGGQLFFSTINRNPKAYLFAILGAEYLLKLIPKGTHDFAKFIKPAEFATWARQADLTVSDLTGLHFNPLSKRYQLNQDVSVNYLIHCRKMG